MSTTTAPKQAMPGPAVISAKPCNWTSPARIATTNTSSIDQRPISSINRYSRARSTRPQRARHCAAAANSASAPSLNRGTTKLATKTITASSQSPVTQK